MASGINFTPDGVPELTRALETLDKLVTTVGKLAGTGTALESLRKIIVGVGNSGSALSELERSVKDLAGIVRGLPVELKSALGGIKTVGVDAGKALGEGVEQGAKESLTKAKDEALARINAIKDAVKVATENAQRSATGAYSTVGPRPVSVSPIIAKEVEAMNREAVALQSAVAKVMKAATLPGGVKSAEDSASVFYAAQDEQKAALAKWEAQLAKEAVAIESAVAKVMKAATFPGGSAKDSASVFYAAQDEQRAAMAKWEAQLAKEAVAVDSAVAKVMKAATLPGYTKSAQDSASVFYAAQDAERAAVVKWEAQLAKEARQLEASVSKVIKAIERPGYTHAGPTWWEKALAEQEAAQIKLSAKNAELVAKIYANNTSGPIMSGTYSNLSNQQRVTPALTPQNVTPIVDAAKAAQGANSLNLMSSALARFTNNAGDAHSAARGLASGFGLLWLTWGNMLPLLAGAAISNSLAQIVKVGAEVGHSFETIRVLSQETGKDIQELEQTLLDLGQRGVYGPKEIAEAMKTMSLAGVSAKDITTSMKDVINLAVAGTTSLKASSDILTSLSAGFDIPAASYSHIADVLTKAAAVSKASIESMSEAFKRASAVHKLYGVSLEDLATELTLVNNLGIQGTAAGTAVLNMYADMQGRTKKVAEAMQKFGVDVKDANGNMKALVPMAMSVAQALDKMLPNKQNEFLRFITGERGARGMVPIIEAARTMSATSTEALTKLEEQQKKVQDNLAFAALSAAQMAMTPLNLMKEVGNSLETSLTKVFKSVERDVSVAAITMREAFASEGFVSALTTLATSIAHATVFVVEHLDTIAMVVNAYLVWKAAVISMAVFGAVEAGVISLTRALVAQRTATLASATAMEVLTAATATGGGAALAANFARALPVIGTIVSLALAGYAAWQLYASGTKSATEETDKFAKLTGGELLRVLGEEEAKLDRQLAQKREGLALDSAAIGVNLEKLKTENQSNEVALKQKILDQESKAARFAQTYGAKSGPTVTAQTELDALKKTYSEMYRLNRNLESDVTDTIARVKLKTLGLRVDTTPKAPAVSGLLDFDKFAKAAHAAKPSDFNYTKDLLTEANAAHSALMQELKREATEEKQIIDAKHKARLTSEAEYQSQSLMATIKEDRKQSDAIEQGWAERNRLISNAMNDIAKEAGGFEVVSEAAKKQGEAFAGLDPKMKALAEGYRKLMVDQGLSNTTFEKEVVTLKQVVAQREALLAIEFQGKIAAEAKAYKDLGRELDVSLQKQRDKLDLEQRLESMSSVQRAGAQAELAFEEQSAQAIAKRTEALQELVATQTALKTILDTQKDTTVDVDPTGNLAKRYDEATEAVNRFSKALQDMKDKAQLGGGIAREIAEIAQARKEADAMAKDMTKNLADAVMKGTAGFKSLWTGLKDWLKQTFSKMVLQPMLQPVMQSIAGQVVGSTAGSIAGQTIGAAAGSSALNSATFSGVGGILGTGVGGMSALAGFGSAASYGASALMAGNGLTALSGGMSMAMAGELAQGIGMIAGVAGPLVIAAMALASLDKKATPHVGGYALSDSKGYVTDITEQQRGNKQDDTQTSMVALAKSSANLLNSMSSKFGGAGGFSVRAVFESDSNDPSWALFHLLKDNLKQTGSFDALGTLNSDPSKGLTEFSGMAADALRTALKEMNLPQWAKDQLDALGSGISISDLSTAADKINATQDAFLVLTKTLAPMAGSLGQLSGASSDTLYNLAQLAGGFDNLTNVLSTYYTNYYSASEQHAASLANLTSEYTKLNMGALPQTKEAFRTVIDQFVAGGGRAQEGGEKTYLTLMQLANGFAALDSAGADTAAWTTQQAALLRAQGKELQAVTVEREAELAALRKTNPEMVLMQQYLWGLQDAAASLSAQQDLQIQIERVLGHESAAVAIERQREIETLQNTHPELVNLQKQLYGVQDAATAAAAALEFNNQASAAQDKFLTPQGKIDKGYSVAAQTLIAKGVSNKSEGDLTTILKGMSKQDIYDFAAAFVKLDGVSLETKTAVVEVAGALAEVKDQSAQLTYDLARSGLEAQIAQMSKDYGDLQAAMDLIVIPIKTMSQQYIDNASAIKTLSDSLDQLLGISKKTPQEILSDMLQVQKTLKDARSSVQDAIFTAKLGGMKPGDKAAALREREASLFAQLKTDKDPAAVVSKLQSVIMERVQAEADAKAASATAQVSDAEIVARLAKMARDAQVATLQAQLDGFKKLKELAAGMGDFIAGLRSGDLSNLSYGKRLTTVKDTFASTLERARNGDPTAVGNLQSSAQDYLKQSQQFYGGASAEYSAIFESVTSSLDALAKGVNVDPQIAKLELQIDKMTAINAAIDAQTTSAADNSAAQVAALEALDAAIAARQAVDDAKIDEQIRLAKAQIDELKAEQELIRGQIVQQYDIFHNLNLTLADLTAAFNKAQSTANMESARP